MAIGRPLNLTANVASKVISATATASQTQFTVTGGYRINELAVYRNGIRLVNGQDYTATDGLTVTLTQAATLSDIFEFQVFDSFNIADAIDSNSASQTIAGDLTVSGTLTATATTATTASGLSGSVTSSGPLTISDSTASTSSSTGALIVTGGVGIGKSLFVSEGISVGGTITYDDVTNIDSIGIVTARTGIKVLAGGISATGVVTATSFAGIGTVAITNNADNRVITGSSAVGGLNGEVNLTFDGNNLKLNDDKKITFGDNLRMEMYTDGYTNYIKSEGDRPLKFYISSTERLGITSTGQVQLSAISDTISDTAVDVFVYDTRKDSDGGAWRKRTQNTSWYNETLNTATRGSRKEFPAVAVIVAEATKVTIYDGDDPDLPMWMEFNTTSGNLIGAGTLRGVTALNGVMVTPATAYAMETRFISDYSIDWFQNQLFEYKGNIEQRKSNI